MIQWAQGPRHQNVNKTQFARKLRRQMTEAERKFWKLLRNRELLNYKFRRQVPFGPYFLDFYCAEKFIAVELDGGQHCTCDGKLRDAKRDTYLNAKNIRVFRYSDRDIFLNPAGVIENLTAHLET